MTTPPKTLTPEERAGAICDSLSDPGSESEDLPGQIAAAIREAQHEATRAGYSSGRALGLREAMSVLDRRVEVLRGLVHVPGDVRAEASLGFAEDIRASLEAQWGRAKRGETDCDTVRALSALAATGKPGDDDGK